MHAHVGDRLIPNGDDSRAGLIIAVPEEDGSPPYVVRWANGHVALVFPGPYARLVRGGTAPRPDREPRPGPASP
jgi:hypothetical protein